MAENLTGTDSWLVCPDNCRVGSPDCEMDAVTVICLTIINILWTSKRANFKNVLELLSKLMHYDMTVSVIRMTVCFCGSVSLSYESPFQLIKCNTDRQTRRGGKSVYSWEAWMGRVVVVLIVKSDSSFDKRHTACYFPWLLCGHLLNVLSWKKKMENACHCRLMLTDFSSFVGHWDHRSICGQ